MKIYLVGGAVRDKLLGLPIKERDWVVVGASASDMLALGYRQVGKEFPVFLHPKTSEEYALARMERKVQPGYKGFTFDTSPDVNLESDLIRRDLTINAMAEDEDGNIIDPYGGKHDLDQKVLRHVSPAFSEDPVRILRIGRFLARYHYLGFHVADETKELMRQMVHDGEVDALVAERVWKELDRALGEKNPEKFFEVMDQCGASVKLFPKLLDQRDPSLGMKRGMETLKSAAKLTPDPVVRFTAFMYGLMEHLIPYKNKATKPYIDNAVNSIPNIELRAPNEYLALTKLTIKHYKDAIYANTLSPEEILNLFSALDIFRREDRFKKFLLACQAIAHTQHVDFNSAWMMACAQAAKSFNVQELVSQGLNGIELAAKLKVKRLELITEWLKSIS